MKKIFGLILFTICIIFACNISYAQDDISVYLDGKKIDFDVTPCIINGRTLVPVRGVLEAAGATVSWDENTRMTVLTKDNTSVMIGPDNPVMTVKKYGKTSSVNFDVAPCIIQDRIFVAIKPVAEAFGINVGWNSEKRMVILDSEYEVSSVPDDISISDFTPPADIEVGSSFMISGNLSSGGVIDRVNIKITDTATQKVQINETQFDVNSKYYYLSDIDSRVKFGSLSVGAKCMEITAVTKNESRMVFTYEFQVTKPQPAEINEAETMLWPVPDSGLITTIFWCDNEFCHSNGGRAKGHTAIDIAAPENTDVIAVKNGKVIKTGFGDSENGFLGYGNFILVDHGNGVTTQYSHLFSVYVSEGDEVFAGQIIGGVGTTGNSTGNHLDFALESYGERCDPLYYLEMHPEARCYEECDKVFFEEAMQKRGIEINTYDEYYYY